jgi:hypothetical protein
MIAKTAYLTTTEAGIYFAGRLDKGAWTDASDADKAAALVQATTDIDKLEYLGTKFELQQEHEFPRLWADPLVDSTPLDSDKRSIVYQVRCL